MSDPIKVVVHRQNEETVKVFFNSREIFSTNYDECGWSGLEAVDSLVSSLVENFRLCGVDVQFEEIEAYGDDNE